ncbi:hypothetical protein C8A05DRAFT_33993 [Staphylotrichum tortipilum]|uniref:Uncharacterized protein n=1 Tax=Staphylotrichum tortipilum TaxID=2831512 RepID=A0AAN6ML88_9PEZI|nr:hypothetical protein C8A05DRAFT_33993 [Staphylotrichum longicolle]
MALLRLFNFPLIIALLAVVSPPLHLPSVLAAALSPAVCFPTSTPATAALAALSTTPFLPKDTCLLRSAAAARPFYRLTSAMADAGVPLPFDPARTADLLAWAWVGLWFGLFSVACFIPFRYAALVIVGARAAPAVPDDAGVRLQGPGNWDGDDDGVAVWGVHDINDDDEDGDGLEIAGVNIPIRNITNAVLARTPEMATAWEVWRMVSCRAWPPMSWLEMARVVARAAAAVSPVLLWKEEGAEDNGMGWEYFLLAYLSVPVEVWALRTALTGTRRPSLLEMLVPWMEIMKKAGEGVGDVCRWVKRWLDRERRRLAEMEAIIGRQALLMNVDGEGVWVWGLI